MAKRQREWAARARLKLIEQFGVGCVMCGERDPNKLEFDHKNGRDWVLQKISSCHRISIYRREAKEGKLRLLCGVCNRLVRETNDNGQFVPTGSAVERTETIPF